METGYERMISESSAPVFTRRNLEILLGGNRRTTDYRIQSLIKHNILVPVKRGMYGNNVLYKKTPTPADMALYIGGIIVPRSYVSLEYALSFYGILAESVYTMTYVTMQKPRKFQNGSFSFSYRNIKSALFFGFTPHLFGTLSYQMASPAKALFDFIYLTPLSSDQSIRELLLESRFNWDVVTAKDKAEFKKTVEISASKKMGRVLAFLP